MRFSTRSFWVQKDGYLPEQCDDAHEGCEPRFAVADGASDSFRSGRWARQLVSRFVKAPFSLDASQGDRPTPAQWLQPMQKDWSADLDSEWDSLPWWAQRKAMEGSHTTLLGLEFEGSRWRAAAVGDSCLFQVRKGQMLATFPLTDAAQFDTNPELVCTDPKQNEEALANLHRSGGETVVGDLFLLATDALACWALGAAASSPWTTLAELANQTAFAQLVERLRTVERIRNDDMTLMVIQLMADEAPDR